MKKRSLRIAILGARGYPSTYGGFETFIRVLAPFLRDRGHDVIVYGRGGCERHRTRVVDGITVVDSLGITGVASSTLTHGASATVDAAVRKPDVALVVNVANGFFLPALQARRVPTVVNVDGIEWERGKWSATGRRVFLAGATCVARWATELIADSQEISRVWENRFGRGCVFIPYGASEPPALRENLVTDLELRPEQYVLAVARLVPENNVELTLDALESTGREGVIVGSFPSTGSELEDRLRGLVESGRVRWLGHVHDQRLLMALWAFCGVYVHGHSVGGTNPALLQALACGAPTVAFDSPFNREVLLGAGRYYRDARELHSAIDLVLTDEQESRRLREHGSARVAEAYRWDDVCSSYANVLERVAR